MIDTNQLYCGESASILSQLPSECIDLVVTDPPYLCGYKDRTGRTVANDDNPEAIAAVFEQIARVMKNNSYCLSFYGWSGFAEFGAMWKANGLRPVGQIVFHKPYASNRAGFAEHRHESAMILAKGRPAMPSNPIQDVQPWQYSGNKAHPTEKAVSVIAPLIRCYSDHGALVLDPFAGAGSTLVAAALNKRRYIGAELDERYCETARRRLAGVETHLAKTA